MLNKQNPKVATTWGNAICIGKLRALEFSIIEQKA